MKKSKIVYVFVAIIVLAIGFMSYMIINQNIKNKLFVTPILVIVKQNESVNLKAELISKAEYNRRNGKSSSKFKKGKEPKDVIWSSSDETIATVDSNGKVTGIKNGEATITVTTSDKKIKEKTRVVVYEGDITFTNEKEYTCKVGEKVEALISITGDSKITRYGFSGFIEDETIAKISQSSLQTNCVDCKLFVIDCLKQGKTMLFLGSPTGATSVSEIIVD